MTCEGEPTGDTGFCRRRLAVTRVSRAVLACQTPGARKLATDLIEDAKESGLVRRALDAAGFKAAEVAPPAG